MQVYAPRKLDKKENLMTGQNLACITVMRETVIRMKTLKLAFQWSLRKCNNAYWFVCNNLVNVSVSSLQFSSSYVLTDPCIEIPKEVNLIIVQIFNLIQYSLPQAQIHKCLIHKYFVVYYKTMSGLYTKISSHLCVIDVYLPSNLITQETTLGWNLVLALYRRKTIQDRNLF